MGVYVLNAALIGLFGFAGLCVFFKGGVPSTHPPHQASDLVLALAVLVLAAVNGWRAVCLARTAAVATGHWGAASGEVSGGETPQGWKQVETAPEGWDRL